ncbi:cyclic AMP-responsive element-binding protein 3-like protein 3-A [Clupea harengus]|uniref:Cyclic AMP-responsive element-binding protein 3-like protein 3-A n=1 Tax=Clupea harengus TaxID=7950 RepID=A0A6P3VQ14_CLUHA|nr:cyclic AMP-responsive element-binding protein 3-like protein 3-A [Clupea harengus]
MEHYSNPGCDGIDLLDLLFDKNDGILRHEKIDRSNQPLPVAEPSLLIQSQGTEDFLSALLSGPDTGSPQWSPSRSDSGISEDLHSDHMDSPLPPQSPLLESQYIHPLPHPKPLDPMETDLPIDLNGWETGLFQGKTDKMLHGSPEQRSQLSSGFPLSVKDLLLSGKTEPNCCQQPQALQQSVQELILNEDERKLLAKEGMMLPAQLPLTKYEERILKKIRRKIRNKQSAQESRKKKKEYIDGLESRMATCTAQNQELQRKVFQLEKCNMSLMEKLRRLQAMVMNGSNKTAQTGTCILVLVLSFSLLLFPSLKPFSDSKVSLEEDFGPVRVQSRSLHNIHSSRVIYAHDHHSPIPEDTVMLKPLPGNQQVDNVRSFLEKLTIGQRLTDFDTIPHNESLHDHHLHHHGDPITGHTATVTLRAVAKIRPHADDM